MTVSNDPVTDFGFTAIARDLSKHLPAAETPPNKPSPAEPSSIPIPATQLAQRIQAYARAELPPTIYNHSMRIYYYGSVIRDQQFPNWAWNDRTQETWFVLCMLHDIGVPNQHQTMLSFEFWGGYKAMEVLQEKAMGGEKNQAESVAEAIIRHNDFSNHGNITTMTMLIQLATTLDNLCKNSFLVHDDTIKNVLEAYPTLGWETGVNEVVRKMFEDKPWCFLTVCNADFIKN